jgi:beta-fructofuranosidase
MDTNLPSHRTTSTSDLGDAHYTVLPDGHSSPVISPRRPLRGFVVILASVVFLVSLVALIINQSQQPLDAAERGRLPLTSKTKSFSDISSPVPRGVAQGVSAKSNPSFSGHEVSYNWTNAMFSWQRTAYHFKPEKNWMNGRYNDSFTFLTKVAS